MAPAAVVAAAPSVLERGSGGRRGLAAGRARRQGGAAGHDGQRLQELPPVEVPLLEAPNECLGWIGCLLLHSVSSLRIDAVGG